MSDAPGGPQQGSREPRPGDAGPGLWPQPPPPSWQPPPPPGTWPPQGAPQGQYGYQPWQGTPPSTNGFAIASLVLGILWLYWIGSVLALVFGYVAKRQIKASGGRQQGSGLATAGIVLGWIGVGFLLLGLVLLVPLRGAIEGI